MRSVRIVLALLMFGAASTCVTDAQTSSSAQAAWQQAVQDLNANDFQEAVPLLSRAASAGSARAQATLGLSYLQGKYGIPHDDRRAAYWLQRAAAQGHRAAEYQLGTMYEDGLGGLARNDGLSYEFGEGVARNRSTAINWLNQAAAQGDGRAGWTAEWLRNPGTPQFQNEAQLGSYISRTVSAWYNGGARGSSAAAGPCSRFPSAMDCFNAARANDEATQQ